MSRGSLAQAGRSEPPQPGRSGTITRWLSLKVAWMGNQPGLPQEWCRKTRPSPVPPSSRCTLPVASSMSRSWYASLKCLPPSAFECIGARFHCNAAARPKPLHRRRVAVTASFHYPEVDCLRLPSAGAIGGVGGHAGAHYH